MAEQPLQLTPRVVSATYWTPRRGGLQALVLVVVSAAFLGLGLWQAWTDAPTYDEPTYIAAGVVAVTAHDVTFDEEHPALGKALAALPVLLAHPVVPTGYRYMNEHQYSELFTQAQLRAGKLRMVMLLSRLVPLLEAVAVGAVIFRLGCSLFGRRAGLLAAVLWLADPLTLGLAHVDGIDIPMALATVLLAWAFLGVLRQPTRLRLAVVGMACGGVSLANEDGLGMAAVVAVVVVAAGWRIAGWRAIGRLIPVGGAAWATVAVSYAVFDPASLLPYVVVPAPFVHGLQYLLTYDTRPSTGYLLGMSWTGGRWWYWPLSMAVKVPWATLAILVGGSVACIRLTEPVRRQAMVAVALPAAVLAVELLQVKRDIGVRYVLPILALWCILASPIAERVADLRMPSAEDPMSPPAPRQPEPARAKGRVAVCLLVALPGVALVQTVRSAPNSLAWVDPGLGPSYQVASNSSLDWGQDFYVLRRWATVHRAFVASFGLDLTVADIPGARPLLVHHGSQLVSVDPRSIRGWVAVSASVLTAGGYPQLGWLRAYCPVGRLDGTILLYRFSEGAEEGPAPITPAGLCPRGAASSMLNGR